MQNFPKKVALKYEERLEKCKRDLRKWSEEKGRKKRFGNSINFKEIQDYNITISNSK